MSVVTELETKFAELKTALAGDLHTVVVKLESVFQTVQQSPIEDVVKNTVYAELHTAATKVQAVADTVRSDVDTVDKVVDAADDAVDKAATK